MTEEGISVTPGLLPRVRIFCVDCKTTADIYWFEKESGWRMLMHIGCHGEQRLVALPHVIVRKAQAMKRDYIDLFWTELDDYGDDAALQKLVEDLEGYFVGLAERQQAAAAVLKSRNR